MRDEELSNVDGQLFPYWAQGMEEVDAVLDPVPVGEPRNLARLILLREGDVLAVRTPDGRELWQGVVRFGGWLRGSSLPDDWHSWFDRCLPACLIERGRGRPWRWSA